MVVVSEEAERHSDELLLSQSVLAFHNPVCDRGDRLASLDRYFLCSLVSMAQSAVCVCSWSLNVCTIQMDCTV